jgi:hypothetical protein
MARTSLRDIPTRPLQLRHGETSGRISGLRIPDSEGIRDISRSWYGKRPKSLAVATRTAQMMNGVRTMGACRAGILFASTVLEVM